MLRVLVLRDRLGRSAQRCPPTHLRRARPAPHSSEWLRANFGTLARLPSAISTHPTISGRPRPISTHRPSQDGQNPSQHTRSSRACRYGAPRPVSTCPPVSGWAARHISAHAAVCIWILPVLACDSVPARAFPKRYRRFMFAKDWRMPRCPEPTRDAPWSPGPIAYSVKRFELRGGPDPLARKRSC